MAFSYERFYRNVCVKCSRPSKRGFWKDNPKGGCEYHRQGTRAKGKTYDKPMHNLQPVKP